MQAIGKATGKAMILALAVLVLFMGSAFATDKNAEHEKNALFEILARYTLSSCGVLLVTQQKPIY